MHFGLTIMTASRHLFPLVNLLPELDFITLLNMQVLFVLTYVF